MHATRAPSPTAEAACSNQARSEFESPGAHETHEPNVFGYRLQKSGDAGSNPAGRKPVAQTGEHLAERNAMFERFMGRPPERSTALHTARRGFDSRLLHPGPDARLDERSFPRRGDAGSNPAGATTVKQPLARRPRAASRRHSPGARLDGRSPSKRDRAGSNPVGASSETKQSRRRSRLPQPRSVTTPSRRRRLSGDRPSGRRGSSPRRLHQASQAETALRPVGIRETAGSIPAAGSRRRAITARSVRR